jgi:hypothetical protein
MIIEWFCLERSFAILVDGSRNFNVPKGGFALSKQGMALVCIKDQMTLLGLQLFCNVGYL